MPLFLYPFLNTVSKTRPFEYLRLTSLGVIGALVKVTGGLSWRASWALGLQALCLPGYAVSLVKPAPAHAASQTWRRLTACTLVALYIDH